MIWICLYIPANLSYLPQQPILESCLSRLFRDIRACLGMLTHHWNIFRHVQSYLEPYVTLAHSVPWIIQSPALLNLVILRTNNTKNNTVSKCGVFSGPYFPVFGPEENSVFGHFSRSASQTFKLKHFAKMVVIIFAQRSTLNLTGFWIRLYLRNFLTISTVTFSYILHEVYWVLMQIQC